MQRQIKQYAKTNKAVCKDNSKQYAKTNKAVCKRKNEQTNK